MAPIFIITIFLMVFSLICPQGAQGGEIYTYTDKDGTTVITNTPIPEKYQRKSQKMDSYRDSTPSESKQQQQYIPVERLPEIRSTQNQRADDSQNKRTEILGEIDKFEREIQTLNDRERSRSSDRSYYNSPERSANLRQAGYLKEKALMLRRSIEGINQPQEAQKSRDTNSQGMRDTKSPSDFLPKVGKYRWQVE